jgi:hypothetical protein
VFYYHVSMRGVPIAWLPINSGQNFNVSGFVMPARRAVPEDDPVVPWNELLLLREITRDLVETARLQASQASSKQALPRAPRPPRPPRPRKPRNLMYRTWKGFRGTLIDLERQMPLSSRKRRIDFWSLGAESPRTIARTMKDYGLDPEAWPPSTWPEDPPNGKSVL